MHTNYNTGEPCSCDRPDDSQRVGHALDAEVFYLLDDIHRASQRAIKTSWSMECGWLAERVAMLLDVGAVMPDRNEVAMSGDLWNYALVQIEAARRWEEQ